MFSDINPTAVKPGYLRFQSAAMTTAVRPITSAGLPPARKLFRRQRIHRRPTGSARLSLLC